MRSQVQFLMSDGDEAAFLAAFSADATLEKASAVEWRLLVGDCPIQFQPCQRGFGRIAAGRLSLATSPASHQSAPKAETLYRRMRAWIRKRYANELVYGEKNWPSPPQQAPASPAVIPPSDGVAAG